MQSRSLEVSMSKKKLVSIRVDEQTLELVDLFLRLTNELRVHPFEGMKKSQLLRYALSYGVEDLLESYRLFDAERNGPGKAMKRWREHRGLTLEQACHLFYFDPDQGRIVDGAMTPEEWVAMENEEFNPVGHADLFASAADLPVEAWDNLPKSVPWLTDWREARDKTD
jgi:hypothetical protein